VQTWISLPFGNGIYVFRLGPHQIAEIERACDAGIGRIYARVAAGRFGFKPDEALPDNGEFRWPELVEIIRQGLIGGGEGVVDGNDVKVSPIRANDLIDAYLLGATDKRMTMTAIWAHAYAVIHPLMHGYDPPKKAKPGEGPAA
jgi:hypothetical protein